jgi:hypothetical protein
VGALMKLIQLSEELEKTLPSNVRVIRSFLKNEQEEKQDEQTRMEKNSL